MIDHVPTLETCQKLKDAGFPQVHSERHCWVDHGYEPFLQYVNPHEDNYWFKVICAAPILTEIMEQLPKRVGKKGYSKDFNLVFDYDEWFIGYLDVGNTQSSSGLYARHKYSTEAAALLWLELNQETNDKP